MRLFALTVATSLLATPCLAAAPKVGDTLSCADGRAVAVIGRIDQLHGHDVASISLFDLVPGSPMADVGHLPVELSALRAGCPAKASRKPLSDNFEEGYATWRKAFDAGHRGYFTVTVEVILDDLLSKLPREGEDL